MKVNLLLTTGRGYDPGRSYSYRAFWLLVEAAILLNPVVTPYWLKSWILRKFGANVGSNVRIKPNVHIKYPWRLTIGNNAWIGERAWIDNFVDVSIGANACISQGAYLCTGSHDWSDPGMGLVVKPITIERGAWICAFARVGPGVTVGEEAVVSLGSVLIRNAEPRGVYVGNPAAKLGVRSIRDQPGPRPTRTDKNRDFASALNG